MKNQLTSSATLLTVIIGLCLGVLFTIAYVEIRGSGSDESVAENDEEIMQIARAVDMVQRENNQQIENDLDAKEPVEIYGRVGTISEIQENMIVLNVEVYNETLGSVESVLIDVHLSDDTNIFRIPFNSEGPEVAALSDLQVGDSIATYASEDIKDKDEFTATSIDVSQSLE